MPGLLSQTDKQRIEALIAEVEAKTAGEIVTLVSGQSDDYVAVRVLWSALLVVGATLLGYLLWHDIPAEWFFAAQPPAAWLAFWLLGRPAVLRRLVPDELMAAAVDARAKLVFLEQGVTETRDRSGILIYLSELEHRVEILADCGIHERLGDSEWRNDVDQIIGAIRQGQAAEGICRVITHLGEELAHAFPPRPDDENELGNRVRRV